MPTETHNETEDRIRDRFQMLGRHLGDRLDDPAPAPPSSARVHRSPRHALRRRVPAMVALLLIGGSLLWLIFRHGEPADTPAIVSAGGPTTWPPAAEVHEHCVEDAQTRALYEKGDYPSEELRAQHCERMHHDLLELVQTPDDVGPGAASSAALADPTASDEFDDALAAHGLSGNDLDIQVRSAELWRAFQTRHAVPVVDPNGQQIGWFGDGFISLEDLSAAQQEAERMIAEFGRTGVLPSS